MFEELKEAADQVKAIAAAIPPAKVTEIVSRVDALLGAVDPKQVAEIIDRFREIGDGLDDAVRKLDTTADNLLAISEKLKAATAAILK